MENQTHGFAETTEGFEDEDSSSIAVVDIIVKTLYSVIGITGVLGNGLILMMLIKIPSLRNTTNLLIGHQSVTDFISSWILLASFLPPSVQVSSDLSSRNRALAQLICKFWVSRLLFWVSAKASTVNLVCITLERYIAVIHPVKYREKLTFRDASVICGVIWFLGFMVEAYHLPTWFLDEAGECVLQFRHRALAIISGVWIFTMTLVVPLIAMSFVYASLFLAFRTRISPSFTDDGGAGSGAGVFPVASGVRLVEVSTIQSPHLQTNGNQARRVRQEKVRRNVLSTLIIVSVTYAICWTPNQLYFLYFNLGGDVDFNNGLYYFTVLAASANMCLNPIIYAFKYKKFQRGMRQIIFRGRCVNSNRLGINTRG